MESPRPPTSPVITIVRADELAELGEARGLVASHTLSCGFFAFSIASATCVGGDDLGGGQGGDRRLDLAEQLLRAGRLVLGAERRERRERDDAIGDGDARRAHQHAARP